MNHLTYKKECLSTNDEILAFLPQKKTDISGIFTLNQTKGRGQYGNIWEIEAGKNIAFSMAVQSCNFPSDTFINFYTAILIRNFLANLTGHGIFIKWPNDLILHQKKISGMLIEKKTIDQKSFYIIGIGLNVLQENFQNLPKAGSLLTQIGTQFDPKEIASQIFSFFQANIFLPQLSKKVLASYNSCLFRKDEVAVFQHKGIRQNGIIRKVDEKGFLWIDLENESLQRFFHKEISMLY